MLAPNKQNLLLLKNQLKVIQNGLKLLREKRSGLVIMLLDFANKGKKLEEDLRKDWNRFMPVYRSATAMISLSDLSSKLTTIPAMNLKVEKKRVSGVYLEMLKVVLKVPLRPGLKIEIFNILTRFVMLFPSILKLNELRLNCGRIAKEIEKTNRQISNLESKLEDASQQIKYITAALNERANHEKATLIKIFG